MPNRRRFGHDNVVFEYSYAVLARRRGMGEGAEPGGAAEIGSVARWPKFRPKSSKGAGEKNVGRKN